MIHSLFFIILQPDTAAPVSRNKARSLNAAG